MADHAGLIERLREGAMDPDMPIALRDLLNEAADALEGQTNPLNLELADPVDALIDDMKHPEAY
jgi:hypothetical protein